MRVVIDTPISRVNEALTAGRASGTFTVSRAATRWKDWCLPMQNKTSPGLTVSPTSAPVSVTLNTAA